MIKGIENILKRIIKLLPIFDVSAYVDAIEKDIAPYLGWINWLFPLQTFYNLFVLWAKCMTAYFVYVTVKPIVMRIVKKVIDGGGK